MLIPFGTQSYQHEARQLSSQRMVNCFLEKTPEGAEAPVAVIRTPGIDTRWTLPASPIRGMAEHQGLLWVVAGDSLYSVSLTAYNYIGPLPGIDRARLFSNGPQLGILDGGRWFVYETDLQEVGSFRRAIDATYLDLFGVFVAPDSADFFITDPGALPFPDFNSFNALDFRTVEASPGNLVAVATDHRELFLFKESNTEIWINTRDPDFPFGPIENASMELGTIARGSIAKVDNTLFWLANDFTVRRADGYTPIRVSQHSIENDITKMSRVDDAIGFAHPYNGHLFYVLTFPTANKTYTYDVTTGLWHERESDGNEWRAADYLALNNTQYVGDSLSGDIGLLNGQTHQDFGDPHRVSVTSPPISNEGRRIFYSKLEIEFEMGRGTSVIDPQAMLQWSDDGGRTWSNEYWRSMGKVGEYRRRAVWPRLGSARHRVFRLSFAEPTHFTLISANAEATVGSS